MSGLLKLVFLLWVLSHYFGASHAANILCVFTSISPSHNIVHMSHARALLERGHNVTVITSLPLNGRDKELPFNHIFIPRSDELLRQLNDMKSDMAKPKGALETIASTIKGIKNFGPIQYDVIKNKRFQDFLHNPDHKFDLIVLGYFFNDYLLGLGIHFQCPVVLSWMQSPIMMTNRFVGNPPEISYVPASPSSAPPDPLTFKGRVVNFFTSVFLKLLAAIIEWQMQMFYKIMFPDPNFPSMEEAGKKVSLVLCNSHMSEGFIRPNVPAVIEVGGIQIKDKPDPLPKDLQVIFNASKEHGVILVSFGSNLESDNINGEIHKTIFQAMSGQKQTVLWKWDAEKTPGNAPNIHYRKWLPQDDLLAQSDVKLFITHAGKGSVAEAQYHGVPMVAIPIFADQPKNANQIEKDGFGVKLAVDTMTVDTFKSGVREVLDNPKYRQNIKRFSELYRDRPMTAKQTAIYWLEYVIRHKGAYHMQSPLVHLNSWQYISADVIAVLMLVVYAVLKLIKILLKLVCKYTYRRVFKKTTSKKVKQN